MPGHKYYYVSGPPAWSFLPSNNIDTTNHHYFLDLGYKSIMFVVSITNIRTYSRLSRAWNYGQISAIFWPFLANVWTLLGSFCTVLLSMSNQIIGYVRSFSEHNFRPWYSRCQCGLNKLCVVRNYYCVMVRCGEELLYT